MTTRCLLMLPAWFIKYGFHLLYYQMAWSYDAVAWTVSFGQWASWRRLALLFMQPGSTLELAFGTGGFFADMQLAGHQPIGIDLSPYMARLTTRRLRQRQLSMRISQAKAQALPFPANCFANVVATFPTNYIFLEETLDEIYRVLQTQPAGRLIIVVEGQLQGPRLLRPAVNWLYKITNQRDFAPAKTQSQFEQHHFKARWEMVHSHGGSARLLVAEKEG